MTIEEAVIAYEAAREAFDFATDVVDDAKKKLVAAQETLVTAIDESKQRRATINGYNYTPGSVWKPTVKDIDKARGWAQSIGSPDLVCERTTTDTKALEEHLVELAELVSSGEAAAEVVPSEDVCGVSLFEVKKLYRSKDKGAKKK